MQCKVCGDSFDPEVSGTDERCAYHEAERIRSRNKYRPEYWKEYSNRSEVKAHRREYFSRPEVKERVRKYNREYLRNRRAKLKEASNANA